MAHHTRSAPSSLSDEGFFWLPCYLLSPNLFHCICFYHHSTSHAMAGLGKSAFGCWKWLWPSLLEVSHLAPCSTWLLDHLQLQQSADFSKPSRQGSSKEERQRNDKREKAASSGLAAEGPWGKDGKRPPAMLPCPGRMAEAAYVSLSTKGAPWSVAGQCPCWEWASCRTQPQGRQHKHPMDTQPLCLAPSCSARPGLPDPEQRLEKGCSTTTDANLHRTFTSRNLHNQLIWAHQIKTDENRKSIGHRIHTSPEKMKLALKLHSLFVFKHRKQHL